MSRVCALICPLVNPQRLAEQSPLYEPAHNSTTMGEEGESVLLSSTGDLLPHEEVIPKNLNSMLKWLVKTGRFFQPIVVDGGSKVILDGHHRWNAAKALGLERVPVVAVDYMHSDDVSVDVWPGCGRDTITKRQVVDMGVSGNLFPPKTSRHTFAFPIPKIGIPLDDLMD